MTIQTLDRPEGNGITMVMVEAEDPTVAEAAAERIAEQRFACLVLADDAVPWPS
ncbi:MAG: hypothetical protein ACXV8R_07055 [Acidimicrobiia bacterium]